jgi:hypothetical protein
MENPHHDAAAADDRNNGCLLGVENGDNAAAVGASDSCGRLHLCFGLCSERSSMSEGSQLSPAFLQRKEKGEGGERIGGAEKREGGRWRKEVKRKWKVTCA